MRKEWDVGDVLASLHEKAGTSVSPRIIILDWDANIPLVRYKDTPWFGLPGGKANEGEATEAANFLSKGAYPTLIREVQEECGIDITESIKTAPCLGLVEIGIVDNISRFVNYSIAPIFVCKNVNLTGVSDNTQIVNLRSHIPGPIFPDARIAINALKEGARQKKGPIEPQWLNDGRIFYFEMKPQMRNLPGSPEWL